jgi:N-acetyltransferase 10
VVAAGVSSTSPLLWLASPQDFEALTPNLLARTVETVEGGGVIVILLRTLTSLRQLVTMSMDVHTRFRTESHHDVVGRFNERFLLSLASCPSCLVIDDHLNVLPISSHTLTLTPTPHRTEEEACSASQKELVSLQESMADTQPVGPLLSSCLTLDQVCQYISGPEATV